MRIGFSSKKGDLISEQIAFFTKQKAKIFPVASHCFPIIGEVCGIELALSADEIMTNIVDVNRYRDSSSYNLRIYEIPDVVPTESWLRPTIKENNQRIYPHLELVWFVYQWFKDQIFPDDPTEQNWLDYSNFCSELTAETLQKAGYSGWIKGFDANSLSPTELETLVATIPKAKLIEERT